MLSSSERAMMIRCCYAHDVAFCHGCARSYRVQRLGADWLEGKTEICPRCRGDLSDSIRDHLRSCEPVATLRSSVLVADSRALWEASVILRKEAQQTRDDFRARVAEVEAGRDKRRKPPFSPD
jgi:hypothetical protein